MSYCNTLAKFGMIKASERYLIIDTGWDREECMNAMLTGLRELKVDLRKTGFFITHLHADHLGLVLNLGTDKKEMPIKKKWESMLLFSSSM